MLLWILAASLAAALLLAAGLGLMLRRARAHAAATDELIESARDQIRAAVQEETTAHVDEIRRTLARERKAGEVLAETLATVERRLDERLRGFAEDLERAQRHLEAQLARLSQRQQEAITDVEARLEREAAELGTTADEQRKAVVRLREELERAAGTAVTEALDELESQSIERRRSIDEITERLRVREAAIAEGIERAETDARARLEVTLIEFERRQTDRLERVTEREIERHAQLAAATFDERMREIREEAATRLARELERAVELITREELARRLDSGS